VYTATQVYTACKVEKNGKKRDSNPTCKFVEEEERIQLLQLGPAKKTKKF
jgi:hypothetical protein